MNTKVMAYEKDYLTGGEQKWFMLDQAVWKSEEVFKKYLFVEEGIIILVVGDEKGHYVFEPILNADALKSFEEATKKLSMELSC